MDSPGSIIIRQDHGQVFRVQRPVHGEPAGRLLQLARWSAPPLRSLWLNVRIGMLGLFATFLLCCRPARTPHPGQPSRPPRLAPPARPGGAIRRAAGGVVRLRGEGVRRRVLQLPPRRRLREPSADPGALLQLRPARVGLSSLAFPEYNQSCRRGSTALVRGSGRRWQPCQRQRSSRSRCWWSWAFPMRPNRQPRSRQTPARSRRFPTALHRRCGWKRRANRSIPKSGTLHRWWSISTATARTISLSASSATASCGSTRTSARMPVRNTRPG